IGRDNVPVLPETIHKELERDRRILHPVEQDHGTCAARAPSPDIVAKATNVQGLAGRTNQRLPEYIRFHRYSPSPWRRTTRPDVTRSSIIRCARAASSTGTKSAISGTISLRSTSSITLRRSASVA